MAPVSNRKSPLVRSRRQIYPLSMIEHGEFVLQLLVSLRFATGSQIQRVLFDTTSASPRQARHRATRSLRRLFDSGLIRRVPVFAPSSTGRMSRQIVNVLSTSGARALEVDAAWIRRRTPKDNAILVHDAWLVELAVRAMAECPEALAIDIWWDDRVLMGRKRKGLLSLPTVPDGLLVVRHLQTEKIYPHLIELDLGTESVTGVRAGRRDVARKIEGYLDYLGRPFRQEFGVDAPPIVLMVTDSDQRMESLKSATQRLGGGGRFWFSTTERLGGGAAGKDNQARPSAARYGPFWASNWQTAHDDGVRSLATRCGALVAAIGTRHASASRREDHRGER